MANRRENNVYIIDTGNNYINGGKALKVNTILFNGTGATSQFSIANGSGGAANLFFLGYDSATKVMTSSLNLGGVWLSNLVSGTVTDGTGFLILG